MLRAGHDAFYGNTKGHLFSHKNDLCIYTSGSLYTRLHRSRLGHSIVCIIKLIGSLVLSAVTIEPDSLNVSLNSIATFTCISPGSSHLFFKINGDSVSDSRNAGRGLNEGSQDVTNGTRYRNITVKAIDINNNTNISCTSLSGSDVTESEPALLRIQGNK